MNHEAIMPNIIAATLSEFIRKIQHIKLPKPIAVESELEVRQEWDFGHRLRLVNLISKNLKNKSEDLQFHSSNLTNIRSFCASNKISDPVYLTCIKELEEFCQQEISNRKAFMQEFLKYIHDCKTIQSDFLLPLFAQNERCFHACKVIFQQEDPIAWLRRESYVVIMSALMTSGPFEHVELKFALRRLQGSMKSAVDELDRVPKGSVSKSITDPTSHHLEPDTQDRHLFLLLATWGTPPDTPSDKSESPKQVGTSLPSSPTVGMSLPNSPLGTSLPTSPLPSPPDPSPLLHRPRRLTNERGSPGRAPSPLAKQLPQRHPDVPPLPIGAIGKRERP
jgi:hypothetical protein